MSQIGDAPQGRGAEAAGSREMTSLGIELLPDAAVLDFPERARGDRLVSLVIADTGIGLAIFDRHDKLVAISCDKEETLTHLADLLDGLGLKITGCADWDRN